MCLGCVVIHLGKQPDQELVVSLGPRHPETHTTEPKENPLHVQLFDELTTQMRDCSRKWNDLTLLGRGGSGDDLRECGLAELGSTGQRISRMIAPFNPIICRKWRAWCCVLLDGARKPELASSPDPAPRRTKTTNRHTPGSVGARFHPGTRLEGSLQPEDKNRRAGAGERDGSERGRVWTPEGLEKTPGLQRSPAIGEGICPL
jgi:hypothetical protein